MTVTANTLSLTPAQSEVLRHRLRVPDALADALCDVHPDDVNPGMEVYHRDDVMYVAELLDDQLTRDRLDLKPALDFSEGITEAVIRDCIEGSTYAACGTHHSEAAFLGRLSALYAVGRKVSELLEDEVYVPDH